MQRTTRRTLIASVTISSLLVAGIAWAGSTVIDDGASPVASAMDLTSSHDRSPSDDRSPSNDSPADDHAPSHDHVPDHDDSPSDDAPLVTPVTSTNRALEAGAITVTAEGLRVRLVDVTVADGWRQEVEVAEGREVEVTFRRDGARIDVKAEVDDGHLRFRVRDRRTDERSETFVSEDGSTSTGDDSSGHVSDDDGDDDDSDDDDSDDDDD